MPNQNRPAPARGATTTTTILARASPLAHRFGNVIFASSSLDESDEEEEEVKQEKMEAIQFAMQSFDVSDDASEEEVELKTNVAAEFVGAVRGRAR